MGNFKEITNIFIRFLIVISYSFCVLNCVNGSLIDDKILEYADHTLQDLLERYENTDQYNFWHPNTFKTGVQSREVIKVSYVSKISIQGFYKQWKYAQLGSGTIVVGLQDYSIDFFDETLKHLGSIKSTENLVAMTAFSEWNDGLSRPEVIVIAATREPSLISYSFTYETARNLGTWPLPNMVKLLELCTVDISRKIIVVPENSQAPVDIYNFELDLDSSQLWFFQRINVDKRTCLAVHEVDSSCSIAIGSENKISVYSFEPRMGYFDEHNKFLNISAPCQQLISFSLAYSEYMAHIPLSNSGQNVEFFSETGKDYLNQNSAPIQATEMTSLPAGDYRAEDILLIRTPFNTTKILSYDGLKKMFRETYVCTPETCPVESNLSGGVGALINGTTVYFAPTQKNLNYATILIIYSKIDEYTSPLYERARQLYSEFKTLSEQYIRFQTIVSNVKTALSDALSYTSPNIITGSWTVKELSSFNAQIFEPANNDSFNVRNNFQNVEFLDVPLHPVDFTIFDEETEIKLNMYSSLVGSAEQRAAKTVPRDSPNLFEVSATQSINNGALQSSAITSRVVQVQGINYDVADIQGFLSGLALIENSRLHIARSTEFTGHLMIQDLEAYKIDNSVTKHFAWLSSQNIFNSSVVFEKRVNTGGNIAASYVGGYRFPEDLVLATNVIGVVLNNLVALDEAHVSVPVRSIKIDKEEFHRDIVSTDTQQHITSRIKFDNIILRENGHVNFLNNQSFVQLVNSIVLRNHNGVIRGSKFIEPVNVVTSESLTIHKSLNAVPFPSGFIKVEDKFINIYANKTFSFVAANSVQLVGAINGVSTRNMVRKHANPGEYINSDWKLLDSVNFVGDVHLKETIGGVNFSDLYFQDTFDVPKSKYFPNYHAVFEAPVEVKYLHVNNNVNGKSFEQSFGNSLLCDHAKGEVFVKGLTTFNGDVTFGHVNVKSKKVNEINVDSFFSRTKDQNITNKNFIFYKPIKFSRVVAESSVDLVDLQSILKSALYINKTQQVLPPELTFESIFVVNTINVEGAVNDFENFGSDVAVKSGRAEQIFESHLNLVEAEMSSLYVAENLAALSEFDGLNITRWMEERVSLSSNATLYQPVKILGKTTFHNDVNTNSVNKVPLDFLHSGVLRKDRQSQTFLSPVSINANVQANGNVQIRSTLNDHSLANIIRDSVPTQGDRVEIIPGKWHLENTVFYNLHVRGKTCGVDLAHLNQDSVRVNTTNVTFSGVTTFAGHVQATDQIETNLLNSLDFSSNVFTLHTPQVISTEMVWESDVTFENEVEIFGHVNNVSLPQLRSIYSNNNGSHSLVSNIKFSSSFTTEHLNVEGLIQNQNFSEYLSSIVYKSDENLQGINGNVSFTQPILSNGNITTAHSYNDFRLPALSEAIVRKNTDYKFKNPVSFVQPVHTSSLVVKNEDISTADSLITTTNNLQISTQELQVNSIPLYSTEPIFTDQLIFETLIVNGNVEGVSSINNVPISEFITKNSQQELGALKVKELSITQRDFNVGGLFGNIDLYDYFKNTVLISNDKQVNPSEVITGKKKFTGKVVVNGGFECLGKDKMSQLVYIQEPNQRIQSRVAFTDDFTSYGDVHITHGKWNNYSLIEVKDCALSKYGNDVISADWTYKNGLVFANTTESHGLIDGVNITKLELESKNKVIRAEALIMEEHSKYAAYCQVFKKLYSFSSHSPLKLQSFDEQQHIIAKKSVESMLTVTAGHQLYLLVSSDSCGVFIYEWSTKYEQFYEFSIALVNETMDKWVQASSSNYGIIVFSSSYSNCYQSMDVGLYFSTLSEQGSMSQKTLIKEGAVVDFKLVTDDSKSTTLLFVVYEDSPESIVVYSWQAHTQSFTVDISIPMSTLIQTMDVNVPRNGDVEILLQTALRVSMFIYSYRQRRVTELNHAEFYGSSNSMKMFQADNSLYALVLSRNSERSSIKPDCAVQLFHATSGELQFVQKLSIYDLVAMEVVHIREQVYVLILTKPVGLYIYKFMGLAGLQAINSYPLKFHSGEHLNAFHLTPWRYNTSLPFVLVSSRNAIKLYHSNILGNAVTEFLNLPNGHYSHVCNL